MERRLLKFRAWDTFAKRMYPEFYIFGETTCFDLISQWVMEYPNGKSSIERMNDVEVMQFTGLKDKDGKDIFEGDILQSAKYNTEALPVVYSAEFSAFLLGENALWQDWLKDAIIIGNIYENPDLCKDLIAKA